MKIRVLQESFAQAISTASRFTSTKAQLPVLGNILLETERNKLIIGSTNLESSISIKIGAKIVSEGSITTPSIVINSLVGNINSESITLDVKNENLSILTTNFRSRINSMNSSDFPKIPHKISSILVNLDKETLVKSIQKVAFASSSDEVRPVLTGILLIFSKGRLRMVATDGFRLSSVELGINNVKNETSFILPKGVLIELNKLASGTDEIKVSFDKSDNQVIFSLGNVIFSSRTIEGEFPDFEKIIPKSHKIRINVDKEELLRAVKLASVFARDSANMMLLSVNKDSLEISAESSQSGKQNTEIDVLVKTDTSLRKSFKIAFNYRFVEEFLGSAEGEEVRIELTDPNSPGVFTDPKDKNYLHLIMPVKLS